jgi:hypothetical protein
MKKITDSESRKHISKYVVPEIAILSMASEQILCGSDWNDGSIDDNDGNWNELPEL